MLCHPWGQSFTCSRFTGLRSKAKVATPWSSLDLQPLCPSLLCCLSKQDALTTTACGILTVLKGQHLRPVQGGFPSIAFPSVGASVSATNPRLTLLALKFPYVRLGRLHTLPLSTHSASSGEVMLICPEPGLRF